MTEIVFDIETTGLDWHAEDAKMHIMCVGDLKGNRGQHSSPQEAVDVLNSADLIIGHNIIGFDIPYLEYITGKKINSKVFDTKVVAGLMFPDVKAIKGTRGPQSLVCWGIRLGIHKGEFGKTTDWKTISSEMIEYCHQDVTVTVALYKYLVASGVPEEAYEMETLVSKIFQKQIERGVGFNKEKAIQLMIKLTKAAEEKRAELQEIFKPRYVNLGQKECKRTRLSDEVEYTKGVKYSDIELQEFNPDSNDQIAQRFSDKYNWVPDTFTPTGKPKVDVGVLSELEYPEARSLIELSKISKLMGYVSDGKDSWLRHEKNGKIHGQIVNTGVDTARCMHFSPNLAQVPKKNSEYGAACRELFVPIHPNHVMVGCDASALEFRCLAHYLAPYDKGRLAKIVEESDIHQSNADLLGCDREMAKHFLYAVLYGARARKLTTILNCSLERAQKLISTFENSMPGYKEFSAALEKSAMKGWIKGLDGRRIPLNKPEPSKWGKMEADYKRLNYLLQSAGAILMKKALCIAYNKNPEIEFILNIHDEIQVSVDKDNNLVDKDNNLVDNTGKLLVDSIREAGEYFNFRCKLDAEYKIGNSWAETH